MSSELLPGLANWKAHSYFQQTCGGVRLVSYQRPPLVRQRVQHVQCEKPYSVLWGQNNEVVSKNEQDAIKLIIP